jgi:hypothetical protein
MHVSSSAYDMHVSSSAYDMHVTSSAYDMHVLFPFSWLSSPGATYK